MRAGSPARVDVERLGRYRLLQRIGGGATSLVFAAHDEAIDRKVALKMIVADLEDEKETRERFYREAKVTAQLFKPSNLFVQRDGSLKILDFGLAKLQASTLTAMGQIVGTPDFMSPEQAAGEKVDTRSDIFSAAAVSYLILTGRAPFTGPNLRRTLDALLHEHPAPMTNAEAPASLRDVLEKGLAKDPARRYQSSAEMLRAVEAVRP